MRVPARKARARLAAEILARRLPELKLRVDLIGVVSVLRRRRGAPARDDASRATRATCAFAWPRCTRDREAAERLAQEVTALYTCGPAGGGGVRTAVRPRLTTASCFVPREAVQARFDWVN